MRKIEICTPRPYSVLIGSGALELLGEELQRLFPGRTLYLVGDQRVMALYGARVQERIISAGFSLRCYEFPEGERQKNFDTLNGILQFLAEEQADRQSVLLALGGGVTGDLVGLAASLYQRGIPYVQLPTTILAAADSSVGGKTAINLPQGKNLVGSFWQPSLVLCDLDFFATLSSDLRLDGMGEVIKTFLLGDAKAFRRMAVEKEDFPMEEMVARCVEIKAEIVLSDEREDDRRRLLNLGHTIGHALESISEYRVHHGQAVAYGLLQICRIAVAQGFCGIGVAQEIEELLRTFDYVLEYDYPLEAWNQAMVQDKKRRRDQITVVLPEAIGQCRLVTLPLSQFQEWFGQVYQKT